MICEPISQVRPEGVFPGFFPTFSTLTKTSAPSAFANDMWWNIVEQPETLILMTIKLMKSWLVHSVSYNSILKSLYNSVLQSLIYSKSPGYGHSSRPGVSLSIKDQLPTEILHVWKCPSFLMWTWKHSNRWDLKSRGPFFLVFGSF